TSFQVARLTRLCLAHQSHKDTKNFSLPSLIIRASFIADSKDQGRFPFTLVSLGGLVSLCDVRRDSGRHLIT
ncbi:MAG: hypothetical protein LGR52_12975, partial [Candidatus Thiosymbion ectosymbiont of Robbea hypermnestra]|nr:hypothetical protein [Candidatus Thiosymbion ectosymbiont of Robbea hypermnestra]